MSRRQRQAKWGKGGSRKCRTVSMAARLKPTLLNRPSSDHVLSSKGKVKEKEPRSCTLRGFFITHSIHERLEGSLGRKLSRHHPSADHHETQLAALIESDEICPFSDLDGTPILKTSEQLRRVLRCHFRHFDDGKSK